MSRKFKIEITDRFMNLTSIRTYESIEKELLTDLTESMASSLYSEFTVEEEAFLKFNFYESSII